MCTHFSSLLFQNSEKIIIEMLFRRQLKAAAALALAVAPNYRLIMYDLQ